MKTATAADIKKELKEKSAAELTALILQLARAKKETKELLTYLLFDAHDPEGYVQAVKEEIETGFEDIDRRSPYWIKKGLRKVLRLLGKRIRHAGSKAIECDLWMYFCHECRKSGLPIKKHTALQKMYDGALKKLDAAITPLHEDLKHDYVRAAQALLEPY